MWAVVVISPATTAKPVVTSVSHATRPSGSCLITSSSTASEIWSAILSGWPSVTDSDVNKKFRKASLKRISPSLRSQIPRFSAAASDTGSSVGGFSILRRTDVEVRRSKIPALPALHTTTPTAIATNLPNLPSARAPRQRIESKCIRCGLNGHFWPSNGNANTQIVQNSKPFPRRFPPRIRLSHPGSGAPPRGFLHVQPLVSFHCSQVLHHAGRPANLHPSFAISTQPEVHRQIAARSIPYATRYAPRLRPARRFAAYLRPYRRAIALPAFQPQLQPLFPGTSVPPQFNPFSDCRHRRINSSVVVKVRKHRPAMQPRCRKLLP